MIDERYGAVRRNDDDVAFILRLAHQEANRRGVTDFHFVRPRPGFAGDELQRRRLRRRVLRAQQDAARRLIGRIVVVVQKSLRCAAIERRGEQHAVLVQLFGIVADHQTRGPDVGQRNVLEVNVRRSLDREIVGAVELQRNVDAHHVADRQFVRALHRVRIDRDRRTRTYDCAALLAALRGDVADEARRRGISGNANGWLRARSCRRDSATANRNVVRYPAVVAERYGRQAGSDSGNCDGARGLIDRVDRRKRRIGDLRTSVPKTPLARTVVVLPGETESEAGSAVIGTGVGVGVGVGDSVGDASGPGVAGAVSSGGGVGVAVGAGWIYRSARCGDGRVLLRADDAGGTEARENAERDRREQYAQRTFLCVMQSSRRRASQRASRRMRAASCSRRSGRAPLPSLSRCARPCLARTLRVRPRRRCGSQSFRSPA